MSVVGGDPRALLAPLGPVTLSRALAGWFCSRPAATARSPRYTGSYCRPRRPGNASRRPGALPRAVGGPQSWTGAGARPQRIGPLSEGFRRVDVASIGRVAKDSPLAPLPAPGRVLSALGPWTRRCASVGAPAFPAASPASRAPFCRTARPPFGRRGREGLGEGHDRGRGPCARARRPGREPATPTESFRLFVAQESGVHGNVLQVLPGRDGRGRDGAGRAARCGALSLSRGGAAGIGDSRTEGRHELRGDALARGVRGA